MRTIAAAVGWVLTGVVACQTTTTEDRGTFAAADASTGDATANEDGGNTSIGEDDAGACAPTMPTERAAPKSIAPFQPGACTTEELSSYISECLKSDGDKCAAYKSASATCAACIETKSTDDAWGPIVFYEGRTYYDYDQGGCIANVTGDLSAEGCGAAQTAYLECRHAACNACITNAFDLSPFYECETGLAVDKTCATEKGHVQVACQAYFASSPKDACQAAGLSSDAYILQLITAWCGPGPSDAGDGG